MTPPKKPSALSTIQKAAQASGLTKRVFSQGATASPAQILMNFKQALAVAGVELTPGETIGLDGIQLVLAGGAVSNDFAEGAATLQCVGDIGIGVTALADILSVLKIITPEESDFVGFGTNLALVLASGGANLMADLGLILSTVNLVNDIGNALFGNSGAALKQAEGALANQVANYLTPQITYAASQVKAYSQGEITAFDLIGNIAAHSPIEFPGLFPEIATYFPSWVTRDFEAMGESRGLFQTQRISENAHFVECVTSRKQVESALTDLYITKPMHNFESFRTVAPVISLEAISVLSMLLSTGSSGDKTIDFDFNVVGAMRGLGLTPYWLGDDWLFKGLQRNENEIEDWESSLPYKPLTLPLYRRETSGVMVGGRAYLTQGEIKNNSLAGQLVSLQKEMQRLDQAGDIEGLLKIPEACAILKRWGVVHVEPEFYSVSDHERDLADYQTRMGLLQNALAQASSTDTEIAQVRSQISRMETPVSPFSPFANPVAGIMSLPLKARLAALEETKRASQAGVNLDISGIKKEIASLKIPSSLVGEITNMKRMGASITSQNWYRPGQSTDPATAQGAQFWAFVRGNYALDLSDYWKCLNVLATMQKSNLFSDDGEVMGIRDSLEKIETQFRKTHLFFLKKQVNILARKRLATKLNIPYNCLASRYDSQGNLIFYKKVG